MGHKHIDLKANEARSRHRLRARDVLRGFESRHHIDETSVPSVDPAPGVVKRILLSIATRTDRD